MALQAGSIIRVSLKGQPEPVDITVVKRMCQGGHAQVLQGSAGGGETLYALKLPDISSSVHLELLRREIDMWKRADHRHVLRFLGTYEDEEQCILVLPWIENGDLVTYLFNNPPADVTIRRALVAQVAQGLEYLHDVLRIVHGDVKCENVLVSKDGEALLADFGLSTVINKAENETPTATEIRVQGTVPFSSPELLKDAAYDNAHEPEPRKRSKTVASDVYAYGMLVLQAYTGQRPWPAMNNMRLFSLIMSGIHHVRPGPTSLATARGLDDSLWDICLRCWEKLPTDRPSMCTIVAAFNGTPIPPREATHTTTPAHQEPPQFMPPFPVTKSSKRAPRWEYGNSTGSLKTPPLLARARSGSVSAASGPLSLSKLTIQDAARSQSTPLPTQGSVSRLSGPPVVTLSPPLSPAILRSRPSAMAFSGDDFAWDTNLDPSVKGRLTRDEHDKLLDLYFTYSAPWNLRVICDYFFSDMRAALSDLSPSDKQYPHYCPALHNIVLAEATFFAPPESWLSEREVHRALASCAVQRRLEAHPIAVVQTYVALSHYYAAIGETDAATFYIGDAIGLGQSARLCDLEPLLRDRAWCYHSTLLQDIQLAFTVGHVPQMPQHSAKIPIVEPLGSDETITILFIHSARLGLLARYVLDYVLREDEALPEPVDNLDERLSAWSMELPQTLSQPKTTNNSHVVVLHIVHQSYIIHLHHKLMKSNLSNRKCVEDAIDSVIEFLRVYRGRCSLALAPLVLADAAYVTGRTADEITAFEVDDVKRCKALVSAQFCVTALLEIGQTWECALKYAENLQNSVALSESRGGPSSSQESGVFTPCTPKPQARTEVDYLSSEVDYLASSLDEAASPAHTVATSSKRRLVSDCMCNEQVQGDDEFVECAALGCEYGKIHHKCALNLSGTGLLSLPYFCPKCRGREDEGIKGLKRLRI